MDLEPFPAEAVEFCLSYLPQFTPLLKTTTIQPGAEVYYHFMCGSLAWTDEMPNVDTSHEFKQFYMALLSLRTRKILVPGEYDFDCVLKATKLAASEWAFFESKRFDPELRATFLNLQSRADDEMDRILNARLRK